MAASTLYTLLVKLGFDVSTLKAGSKDAQVELNAIGQAAKQAAANGSPAATALSNMAKAAQQVAGSTGATAVLRNMAAAADEVNRATRGSAGALNAFTSTAQKVAQATGNGTALNNYSKAVTSISNATGGSVKALTDFSKGVNRTLIETNGSVAGLNRYMRATVAAAEGAGSTAGAIQAVGAAARGSAPSLAEAAGAAEGGASATGALGNAAEGAAGKIATAGRAAAGTAADVDKMTGAAMRSTKAVKEVGEAATATATKAGFLQRTLSMAFAFGGGVAVTTAIGFIGNALLGFNSRLQQAHIAFTTLLGDSGAADVFIKKMEDFANVTPFDFAGVQDATQRLLAMGFTAEQVLPTLRAVGDAVAGLGGSRDTLDRVTLALGQMKTAAHLNAQDMRQLTEAGIPAWQMLADAIHKSVGETVKMAASGAISTAQAVPAIIEGMNARFAGLMAKQARTAQGAFSTIRDAALQTISGAIAPLFDALTSGLAALADFFVAGGGKYFVPLIYAIGIAIGAFLIPRMIDLIGKIEMVKISFFGMSVPLLPLIAIVYALGLAWQENFGGIRDLLGPVIKAVANFAGAVVQAAAASGLIIPILTVLITMIGVKYVIALAASAAGMLANAVASAALSVTMSRLAFAEDAAAIGATTMASRLGILAVLAGGPVTLAIGLIVGAITLLLLNFDRASQGFRVFDYAVRGAVKGVIDALSHLPFVGDMFKGLSQGMQKEMDKIAADASAAEARINAAAAANKPPDVSDLSDPKKFQDFINSFKNGVNVAADATKSLIDSFATTIDGVVAAAKEGGAAAMSEFAKAILDHQNAPIQAMQALHDALRTALSPQAEIARNVGILQSEELAVGLASGIPAVRAAAEAARKAAIERLDELTGGAYSAGQNTTVQLAAGMLSPHALEAVAKALTMVGTPIAKLFDSLVGGNAGTTALNNVVGSLTTFSGQMAIASDWNKKYAPTADAVTEAQKAMNEQLNSASRAQGLSDLNSAFSAIQAAAHKMFDAVHAENLKLIDDALRHKNALLDAKEALNQAPVTAAQKALDFQRKAIEEWRLRQAVSHATSPEQYRDAVLALQDFLAQKHIDEMQAQVDTAKGVIEAQKQRNSDLAALQKAAEDRRYDMQQQAFDHELKLLQDYLAKHPQEWANTQGKIMKLLNSYGISYQTAGSTLGKYFVGGLREQINAAVAAVKAMADLIPGMTAYIVGQLGSAVTGGVLGTAIGGIVDTILGSGTTKPGSTVTSSAKKAAGGDWRVMKDNMLYSLHQDEMVLNPELGQLARQFASHKFSPKDAFQPIDLSGGGSRGGGATIIFQVGEEVLAEATDRSLQVQGDMYGNHRRVKARSTR